MELNPTLTAMDRTTGVLEIPSFRSEFFEKPDWQKIASELPSYRNLIVDIRENSGGNFVAMLRALSTFYCRGKFIGRLVQPRKSKPVKPAMDDDTADDYQISELDQFSEIGLKTFPDYGCYKGRVTVLISSETSSTAEIFAESFMSSGRGRVWGQPSSGDVVLAIWYLLPSLGPGYSVSVPEATYISNSGHELEGHGVWPQRELYYDLKLALQGKDSWIVQAAGGN
jgi:C-terminal processing protease CtpA/Prc